MGELHDKGKPGPLILKGIKGMITSPRLLCSTPSPYVLSVEGLS